MQSHENFVVKPISFPSLRGTEKDIMPVKSLLFCTDRWEGITYSVPAVFPDDIDWNEMEPVGQNRDEISGLMKRR